MDKHMLCERTQPGRGVDHLSCWLPNDCNVAMVMPGVGPACGRPPVRGRLSTVTT